MDINTKIEGFKNKLSEPLKPIGSVDDISLGQFETKTCDEIKEILSIGGVLVDVRSPADYFAGRVHNSVNIPLMYIVSESSSRKWSVNLPILIYSTSGVESEHAKTKLNSAGFKNVHNIGKLGDYPLCS